MKRVRSTREEREPWFQLFHSAAAGHSDETEPGGLAEE